MSCLLRLGQIDRVAMSLASTSTAGQEIFGNKGVAAPRRATSFHDFRGDRLLEC
jgi:hypothetical protein